MIPAALAIIVAAANAYSFGVGLDKRVTNVSKLHSEWRNIHWGYEHLWNHPGEDGGNDLFLELDKRASEASQLALEVPHHTEAIEKWEHVVYSRLKSRS